MESLNLNTLVNSLPNGQQNAEKELLNDFKAAALSITTLYRSSRKNSKRAYNAGYAAACQDLLNFVQQGVSASDIGQSPSASSQAVEGGGMTIGRVMDWTEARVEAIRAREEEEDEDEEKEKEKDKDKDKERVPRLVRPAAATTKSDENKPAYPPSVISSKSTQSSSSLPAPNSPVSATQPSSIPASPSPPPLNTFSRAKSTKMRPTPTKDTFHPTAAGSFISEPPFSETPIVFNAGAKRRHAVMMMLDSNSPAISIGGGPSSAVSSPGANGTANGGANTPSSLSRRRTRNSRPHSSNISLVQMAPEDMDIDEDGRERKRVARR